MNKVASFLAVGVVAGTGAVAPAVVELRVHMPGIPGQDSTLGYPGAMDVSSITIQPGVVSFEKPIDAASAALFQATAFGTPFATASVLQYNPPAAGQPDGALGLTNVLISAYQTAGPNEQVTLSAANPGSLYLVVPGIVGVDPVPGYPQAIQVDSFKISATGDFEVDRVSDAASPLLLQAVAFGTQFPSASLLFYNTAVPGAAPDAIFNYGNLLASAYQTTGGVAAPTERVTFTFASVPEPTGLGVLLTGAAAALCGRSRRRA